MKDFYLQLKELKHLNFIYNQGNPHHLQHSDSHPCTSPPLGGHQLDRRFRGWGGATLYKLRTPYTQEKMESSPNQNGKGKR